MNLSFSKVFSLALAGMLCSVPTFAAMPLETDDTGTQGAGKFQIEAGMEYARDRESADGVSMREKGWELATTLSYGLSDTIDLVAGVPLSWSKVWENGVAVADENGIGDLSLQLKWRFFESADQRTSLALKPGISLPTGDEAKGLGNGRVCGDVTLIATHTLEHGALHLNLGYEYNDYAIDEDRAVNRKSVWRASLAGEVEVAERLMAVADIGVETNEERDADNHPAYLLGGLIYSVSKDVDLDFGVRGGLNDAETDTAWLAGITMRF
ncbi:transporter [Chlorobaculum sp. MV4-Y]|uniref:transporter n=1 Tax=Chlorobaculum sp. MV4-Y TaxID=2976335 RepID=UPI0021AF61FC|nr:transporter [Chlorobaculum sp. MV4-Y]UWX57161.1 transporter [Chlorobaculum sp. MV4-Y]